jgi:hypothetical protein
MLDEVRIRDGDDQDGDGGHRREDDGQVLVRAERLVRLLGAVRGGRQAVRAEAHPGQEGDEGGVAEDLGIADVSRLADDGTAELLDA